MSLMKSITLAIALCAAALLGTANRAVAAGAVMPAALELIHKASAAAVTSDVIKVAKRRGARRGNRRARRGIRGGGRRARRGVRRGNRRARRGARRGGRRARRGGRRAHRGNRRYHRRHNRRHRRRRARVHIGIYPYYYGGYPYYYGGYYPYYGDSGYYYSPRRYRGGRCGKWRRRCRANWGYRNSDYYGCLRYHGC